MGPPGSGSHHRWLTLTYPRLHPVTFPTLLGARAHHCQARSAIGALSVRALGLVTGHPQPKESHNHDGDEHKQDICRHFSLVSSTQTTQPEPGICQPRCDTNVGRSGLRHLRRRGGVDHRRGEARGSQRRSRRSRARPGCTPSQHTKGGEADDQSAGHAGPHIGRPSGALGAGRSRQWFGTVPADRFRNLCPRSPRDQ